MGGKPVVEMAKQIDAEMDKSGYVPPHRNCTTLTVTGVNEWLWPWAMAKR